MATDNNDLNNNPTNSSTFSNPTLEQHASTVARNTTQINSQTGDVLAAMNAEQNKLGGIESKLEENTKAFKAFAKEQLALHQAIKEQTDMMKRIYNILVLWGKRGGISDPSRHHLGYEFVHGGSLQDQQFQRQLQQQQSRLFNNLSDTITNQTQEIERNTRTLSNLQQEIQRNVQSSMDRLDSSLEQTRASYLVSRTQMAATEREWHRTMEAFHEYQRSFLESRITSSDTAETVNQKISPLDYDYLKNPNNIKNLITNVVSSASEASMAGVESLFKRKSVSQNQLDEWYGQASVEAAKSYNRRLAELADESSATTQRISELKHNYEEKEKEKEESGDQASEDLIKELEELNKRIQEAESKNKNLNKEREDLNKDEGKTKFIENQKDDIFTRILGENGLSPEQLQWDNERRINSLTNIMEGLGEGTSKGALGGFGKAAGSLAGEAASEIATPALTAALTPVLGPLAPVVGEIGGKIIGQKLEKTIIGGFEAVGEALDNYINMGFKASGELVKIGLDKIRQDVKTMSAYQIDVYQEATQKIYSAWDKNLSQVSATQGYTKEAINQLQQEVAQRLDELGFENAINAADFTDVLASALSANLGGELANEFAVQSMILQKAVPEFNSQSMAEQFAAIWTRAMKESGAEGDEKEKAGREAMVDAMEQVAGAIKTIEKTTDGNNQFIKQVPAYLTKAEEMVARAGGSVDKVAELTTQMMAAEGPLASLTPQLSGFTGELVDILTSQNNSTAVALRAIMHDLNEDIGITATDFLKSFMNDTQGTLETAYRAIDEFINLNMNPAAEQEFYEAMTSLFGISAEKLSQVNFGDIADELSNINSEMNKESLKAAQQLLKEGETATLQEQLVNNTANLLLSTNAVADTLDNAIMRELEKHELSLEKLVYETVATQSVDLAESTLEFFRKISDVILTVIDPLGFVRGLFGFVTTSVDTVYSAMENIESYKTVAGLSSVGERTAEAEKNTYANTVGGVTAELNSAIFSPGNTIAAQMAMRDHGVTGDFQDMVNRRTASLENPSVSTKPVGIELNEDPTEYLKAEQEKFKEEQRAEWEAQQTQAQADVRENEERKQAAVAVKDEAITKINETVTGFTDYFISIDNLIGDTSDTVISMEETIQNWEATYFEPGVSALAEANGKIDVMQSSVESIYDTVNADSARMAKWWEKDEPFMSNLEEWIKTLTDHITVIQHKLQTDFYKSLDSMLNSINSGVVSVQTGVTSLKTSFDTSLGNTGGSLSRIESNQGILKTTIVTSTSQLQSELSSMKNSSSNTGSIVSGFSARYNELQLIANSSLSNIGLASNQTSTNIHLFYTAFEKDIADVMGRLAGVKNSIEKASAEEAGRDENFVNDKFKSLADSVKSIKDALIDDSKNIVLSYLKQYIYPSIEDIRDSNDGYSLRSIVEKLDSLLSIFGNGEVEVGTSISGISTSLSSLTEVIEGHQSSWDSIDHTSSIEAVRDAIESIDFSPQITVENA